MHTFPQTQTHTKRETEDNKKCSNSKEMKIPKIKLCYICLKENNINTK